MNFCGRCGDESYETDVTSPKPPMGIVREVIYCLNCSVVTGTRQGLPSQVSPEQHSFASADYLFSGRRASSLANWSGSQLKVSSYASSE